MERADKGLWSALRRVARPDRPLDLLIAVWPLMVGRRLAAHTRPVSWNKGRVDVAVESPEWQRQLEDLSKDVQKQINRWWGTDLVRQVRFVQERDRARRARRAGPGSASSGELELAGPAREVQSQPPSAGSRDAVHKLSAALEELEPTLRGIADEELRELIAKVASQYLSRQDKK